MTSLSKKSLRWRRGDAVAVQGIRVDTPCICWCLKTDEDQDDEGERSDHLLCVTSAVPRPLFCVSILFFLATEIFSPPGSPGGQWYSEVTHLPQGRFCAVFFLLPQLCPQWEVEVPAVHVSMSFCRRERAPLMASVCTLWRTRSSTS